MNWAKEFSAALTATLEAGSILRREWHRGPRGVDEYAVIDALVERKIQRRLFRLTPFHQYLGEELGRIKGKSRFTWVVDPNDGTQHYLKKRRGASVSIALLEGDILRLGIVYAYNHPTDEGTLITWAEGGPVQVNGRPVWRQWPSQLLSCKFLFPLGFTTELVPCALSVDFLPSIAYRLSLLAVGNFDATFTLSHPRSWDIAAGHAILSGSKGTLHDEQGKVPIYTDNAECHYVGGIFAGTLPAVQYLQKEARRFRT